MTDTASGLPPVPRPAEQPKQIVTPLSGRALLAAAVGTALVVAAVVTALWIGLTTGGSDPNRVTAQLEVLRIGLSLGLGGGGLFALYLAWRRQRSTDLALLQKERDQADVARAHALQERVAAENRAHQERVALATESDATARRITELFSKAVEHLGAGEAPVRLGGLYALERLAQDNSEQRQTIVNVMCAYLRMPVDALGEPDEGLDAQREREVRLTAQRILASHLRPGPDPGAPVATFWPGLDLDLTGAVLLEADFSGCHLHVLQLNGVTFRGTARFAGTTFAEDATFEDADFTGEAQFGHATFAGRAQFRGMTFAGSVDFAGAQFLRGARFEGTSFTADAGFAGARFARRAWFDKTVFARDAEFGSARFASDAEFRGAAFTGNARFVGTTFATKANFHGVAFRHHVSFREAVFARDVSFQGVSFDGPIGLRDATFRRNAEFRGARFAQSPRVTAGQFPNGVPPELSGPTTPGEGGPP